MAWLWAITVCTGVVGKEPATRFDFNGPGTTWQISDKNRVGRILSQECTTGGARDDAGVERIVVAAPGGESLQLICPTAAIVVMEELEVRVWVNANRPGIQLAARVELPRTGRDGPASARRVIVRGERYERAGRWQQLVLHDVPKRLAAEVRVLRSTTEEGIDSREAFVEAVVLIVPGEPHGLEVLTDELVVDGVVRRVRNKVQVTSYPANENRDAATVSSTRSVPANLRRLPDHTTTATTSDESAAVRLHGDLLRVNDKPFLPRAIQYRGEPLPILSERGFNVVWLDRVPTVEEAAAAKKLGLWFIGLPPRPEALMRDGVGQAEDRVIAWYLADAARESDPNYLQRWAELIRERDAVSGRPVMIAQSEDWSSTSTSADVLVMARSRLGFAASDEYDRWLKSRSSLIRPGVPCWTCIPSQFGSEVGRQISSLSGGTAGPPPNLPARQFQSLVEVAYTHCVRGFAFQSETPISEPDAATRFRATQLELVNRRLQRIEPWLASGKVFGRFSSADAAWTGIVLSVDQSRLLIPVANTAALRKATTDTREEVAFTVPGVPESCQVYVLTPAAFKALPTQRVAGGTRFAMRPDHDAFVLMTEDPKVVQSLRQWVVLNGERVVRLLRESAALNAVAISQTARRLNQHGLDTNAAIQVAASATSLLPQVDAALASHRVEQAYLAAVEANAMLDQTAADVRSKVGGLSDPQCNPLALSDERLAEFVAFERARPAFQAGDNLLYGGDFEDVGQLTESGWRHFQDASTGLGSQAELSVTAPQQGQRCLMLKSNGSAESLPTEHATNLWIESPPIPVTGGQILEITGWARIEVDQGDRSGRLQLIDSLGGPDLAVVIRQTQGWERFHVIRAVSESTELRLTFAFSGLGTAWLDAVMVRPVQPPPARRLPVLVPAKNAAAHGGPSMAPSGR